MSQRTGTLLGEAKLGPAGLPWDWHRVPAKGDVSCWTPRSEDLETLKPLAPARASPQAPKQRGEPADARRRQLLKSASVELDAWYDAGLRAPRTGLTPNPKPCSVAAPAAAVNARPRAVRFSDGPAEPAAEQAESRGDAAGGAGSGSAGAEPGTQGGWAAPASSTPGDCIGVSTSAPGQAAGPLVYGPDVAPQGAGRASTPQHKADQGGLGSDPAPRDAGYASAPGRAAEQGGCGVSPRGGPGAEPAQLDGWLAAGAALADSRQAGLDSGLRSAPRLSHVSPFCATPPSGLSSAADSRQSSVSGREPWAQCRNGALHQPAGGPSASRAAEWGTPVDDADALGTW